MRALQTEAVNICRNYQNTSRTRDSGNHNNSTDIQRVGTTSWQITVPEYRDDLSKYGKHKVSSLNYAIAKHT